MHRGWEGIPVPIWMKRVFASTTPRAASEHGSTRFLFCSKDDLCWLAHLCHAEHKPYLKEVKIIMKSVVCVSKIKLLHFFHPFASHFPGSSTNPQAATCHGWLMHVIQQQGAIFMGIHDFLNIAAFASQPALHKWGFLKGVRTTPKKPWRHFHSVWVFERMPSKRKKVY